MARRRKQKGRGVSGILLLDKPVGMTSNAALQEAKQLFKARKAGHTGSLDPLASGLLPLCFGQATRISAYLLDSDKTYVMRVRLGERTTTADAEGEIIDRQPAGHIRREDLERILPDFTGEIEQLPPMYSAVKHQGQRLYKLAREGITVAREPRRIHVYDLEILNFDNPEFEMRVACSKGTYVRTLAEDMGQALGVGAHITALRRTQVGPYSEQTGLVSLAQLRELRESGGLAALDRLLLPLDTGLAQWPAVHLTADGSFYIRQGQAVLVPKAPSDGWVRIYGPDESFIGVGEINDDGLVAPKRILQGVS